MLSRRSILVRQAFDAYRCHDRAMLEAVLADDFRFTSPYDDAIDRATYFDRCWPNNDKILEHELERVVEIDDAVIVTYCCITKAGKRFRNTEVFTVDETGIHGVEVYFGPQYDAGGNFVNANESCPSSPEDSSQIRKLLQSEARAIHDRDAVGAVAPYASDVVKFDLDPPLAHEAPDALDPRWIEQWFQTWAGPIDVKLRDLVVEVAGPLAVCYGYIQIGGTKTDGNENSVWARRTVCLRRDGAAWRIFHEHVSVPFYMDGTERAATDLEPAQRAS